MNANELADVLEELHEQDKADGVAHLAMPEAAAMLRQQQAELDALKKLVHQRFDDGKRLGIIETEDRLRKAQEK